MKSRINEFLFTSFEDCCQRHFESEIRNCREASAGPQTWYPDFDGHGGCKGDGKAPKYMKRYPGYLFYSLEVCCQKHYFWNLLACMNPALAPDPCSSDSIFSNYDMYNEDFLLESEVGYYPVCKYQIDHVSCSAL